MRLKKWQIDLTTMHHILCYFFKESWPPGVHDEGRFSARRRDEEDLGDLQERGLRHHRLHPEAPRCREDHDGGRWSRRTLLECLRSAQGNLPSAL